jgi:transposase-like protein
MDDKTAELRDIFVAVTDEETVTESQAETPGSLVSGGDVRERLADVVAEMREALEFHTSLSTDELVTVVERFYAGDSDAAIARELGDESRAKTVSRARLDLHLLREGDTDPPFDFDAFRDALDGDASTADLADRFDVSESTVRRYRRVVEAQRESRRVNRRYRDEFESVLSDGDLAERFTDTGSGTQEALQEATEDQEVDVSF